MRLGTCAVLMCLAQAATLSLAWAQTAAAQAPGNVLEDLTRLRPPDTRSRRISSFDPTGGNNDRIEHIAPGERKDLARIKGPGAINHIWITIAPPPPTLSRHDIILRMYWDDEKEPSVEAPIGEFFGQGWNESYPFSSLPLAAGPREGRALVSYFQMPFAKSARVEIENDSGRAIDAFYYYIDYVEMKALPPNTAYFHAWYNQKVTEAPPSGENEWSVLGPQGKNIDGKRNYLFADIEGRGHYVGVNYFVNSPGPMWYGEGDDMFFIDGEPWPSRLHGTGTEDYFNTSWSPNTLYQHPFFGYARVNDKVGWLGKTHVYRFHITDPIYFDKSLRATIEHGHDNNLTLELATVAYWYQTEPHKPFPKFPTREERTLKPEVDTVEIHRWRDAWRKSQGNGAALWGNERTIAKWSRFETSFTSRRKYENPLQETDLRVTFTSPSKKTRIVDGFWDGGSTWRVRFSPDEEGEWTYITVATTASGAAGSGAAASGAASSAAANSPAAAAAAADAGLHGRTGSFRVGPAIGPTRFEQHGPVRVSTNKRFLEHADGTPFFWLADTAWNAALLAEGDEWSQYLRERSRQQFTAVQFVTTQWRASPEGDRQKARAYTGREKITVDPDFFRRLDARLTSLNEAGLLAAPVLLWAISGGSDPSVNPGVSLPDDQAIKLARYMIARWQAHDVIWILPGDGDYRGEKAEKWKRIGRGVFGAGPGAASAAGATEAGRAPVVLHPGGMHWVFAEFKDEAWVDLHGYQSGHGDDDKTMAWMTEGPPSKDWKLEPAKPFINLEPPYEYHLAYQSKTPITPHTVRRAVYWSLLNAPVAGVTYGGHGVWGWDDGTKLPTDHTGAGVPLPWQKALVMPGAEQMAHVASLFTSIDYWRLRPAPQALTAQPGAGVANARRFIAAAASEKNDLLVVYTPEDRVISLAPAVVPQGASATWFDPRTGARTPARPAKTDASSVTFETPAEGDWILLIGGRAR